MIAVLLAMLAQPDLHTEWMRAQSDGPRTALVVVVVQRPDGSPVPGAVVRCDGYWFVYTDYKEADLSGENIAWRADSRGAVVLNPVPAVDLFAFTCRAEVGGEIMIWIPPSGGRQVVRLVVPQ